MESARCPPPKAPSPTRSVASKGEQHKLSPGNAESPNLNKEITEEAKPVIASQQVPEKVRTAKAVDVSEATHESMSVKEPASQGSAPLPEEEVQQKLVPIEAGNDQSLHTHTHMCVCVLGRDGWNLLHSLNFTQKWCTSSLTDSDFFLVREEKEKEESLHASKWYICCFSLVFGRFCKSGFIHDMNDYFYFFFME